MDRGPESDRGRRAKNATAYDSALKYLRAGSALLTEDTWPRNYELVFSIEYLMAECELLTADMAAAENRLSRLVHRTKNRHDFCVVTRLRLTLYTASDQSNRGVDVFLDWLRQQGTVWSNHPTRDDVMPEYERIWTLLGTRTIEELVDLPLATDTEFLDTLDVFSEIVTPTLFYDEHLYVAGRVSHGESESRVRQLRWFVFRLCVVLHVGRAAVQQL